LVRCTRRYDGLHALVEALANQAVSDSGFADLPFLLLGRLLPGIIEMYWIFVFRKNNGVLQSGQMATFLISPRNSSNSTPMFFW
jgi:hypothetical protein